MKPLAFTALAALTLIAVPAQADYITCNATRDDGQKTTFKYTTNEAESTLTETIPSTGKIETNKAAYSANTIVSSFPITVRGRVLLRGQIELNRQTGELRRALGGINTWTGTCKATEAPVQLF